MNPYLYSHRLHECIVKVTDECGRSLRRQDKLQAQGRLDPTKDALPLSDSLPYRQTEQVRDAFSVFKPPRHSLIIIIAGFQFSSQLFTISCSDCRLGRPGRLQLWERNRKRGQREKRLEVSPQGARPLFHGVRFVHYHSIRQRVFPSAGVPTEAGLPLTQEPPPGAGAVGRREGPADSRQLSVDSDWWS